MDAITFALSVIASLVAGMIAGSRIALTRVIGSRSVHRYSFYRDGRKATKLWVYGHPQAPWKFSDKSDEPLLDSPTGFGAPWKRDPEKLQFLDTERAYRVNVEVVWDTPVWLDVWTWAIRNPIKKRVRKRKKGQEKSGNKQKQRADQGGE